MKRFLKNLAKHPGTWTFLSLLFIGIAIAVPPVAPALITTAGVFFIPAMITSLHFLATNKHIGPGALPEANPNAHPTDRFNRFRKQHPVQFAIALLAFGLFITALVLTIGFFTGGAGFAFMAPVFAAIAAPFASAAVAAGIQLAASALAAITLVLASVNIPNTIKRFAAWWESFRRDHAAQQYKLSTYDNKDWLDDRDTYTKSLKKNENPYPTILGGIKANITNGFSSPDAELLEAAKVKRA